MEDPHEGFIKMLIQKQKTSAQRGFKISFQGSYKNVLREKLFVFFDVSVVTLHRNAIFIPWKKENENGSWNGMFNWITNSSLITRRYRHTWTAVVLKYFYNSDVTAYLWIVASQNTRWLMVYHGNNSAFSLQHSDVNTDISWPFKHNTYNSFTFGGEMLW